MYNHKKQQKLNQQHLLNPQVGDYWMEAMFVPICVIVGRSSDKIFYCDQTKASGPDRWTWETSSIKSKTSSEFKDWLSYNSPNLKDQTWCDVQPKAHEWVRKVAMSEIFGGLS
jgi:hypothetical protein